MTDKVLVEVTPKAVDEIQKIKTANNIPTTHGLRVGIKGGGCCGISYALGFEEKSVEGDSVYETNGLKIFLDKLSGDYLAGAQLDFQENEYGKGFVFNNVKQHEDHSGNSCSSGSCEGC